MKQESLIISIDISNVESAFNFHCPVCGAAWTPSNKAGYCKHVAFDFAPEYTYIAERFMTREYEEDSFQFIEDIAKEGCIEKLFIYEMHEGELGSEPIGGISQFAYSLKEWEDTGLSFI